MEIGEQIPDLGLKDVDGTEVRLHSLLGDGWTMLVFYRGSWCPMCDKQLAGFEEDAERFARLGVRCVAVSTDGPNGLAATLKKSGSRFPVLSDAAGAVLDAFGVAATSREWMDVPALLARPGKYAMPSLFLISNEGEVVMRHISRRFSQRPSNDVLLQKVAEAIDKRTHPVNSA